ncbi:dihydrodipicolinate synthase family protein [Burkholderia cenocepacia]|uniref:dihydrodipicolinate synthase family protein n=1 Tax=Burkholderia cenocepacia TaxID=95486 RepID=UPI000F59C585|nr:dihydrodipicolinate synthase family protein [Burkholderia cenocepacia]MCW3641213.1 dihydrodipicolinate synthase family protein [Burkholderia cenocepacia]RQU61164.1 dihydrodipicolinate synthase family protein [Burkholderia cenocepacia]RQV33278.1 dihydrodipicolinate synthase family protein [Burkholderia cenocepacia]
MARYHKHEARDWAREHLMGVANVTIPTMTSDFRRINEKAVRHDVELAIEHGFVGSLSCSEVAITQAQYGEFCRIMADQAAGRLLVVHHAVFNTLEDNIDAVKLAEDAGADVVLLGYPPYFYPTSYDEVFDYTQAICAATNLGVIVFPLPAWGFGRLHPADIPLAVLRRMVDEIPNVVAIKAEGGLPYIMSAIEVHREFNREVVISSPLEYEYVPLAQVMDIPFCGTNYSAYYGPLLPRIHKLIRAGQYDEATQLWYGKDPARKAFASLPMAANGLLNRMMWKYQGWLQGYNGGPLPHPTQRVFQRDMAVLRKGLEAAGLNPTRDPDEAFFIGRRPD